MTDLLNMLADLRSDLRKPLTDELATEIWDKVLSIETQLEGSRHWKAEEPLVRRLRSTVSDVFAARNAGAKSLPIANASVAVTALESAVQRTTSGEDGWPLRR